MIVHERAQKNQHQLTSIERWLETLNKESVPDSKSRLLFDVTTDFGDTRDMLKDKNMGISKCSGVK